MNQAPTAKIKEATARYPYGNLATSRFLTLCFVMFITIPSMAQIRGSVHDFTSIGWSGGELCSVCHVPHTRKISDGQAPVWNHEITSATYILYGSSTLTQIPEQPSYANVSRLCLSCHDGTIALDSFGGNQGSSFISDHASMGTDLSNDHPIGIRMIRKVSDNGGTGVEGVKIYNGKIECPSCHDVHNNKVSDEKLLRVTRIGSRLCFQCHEK